MNNIRIEPYPPERGRKVVLVDDVQWGIIHMTQHGVHGSSYVFHQIGSGEITEPYDPPSKQGRERIVKISGDKWAKRRLAPGETLKPLADRLADEATRLVARNLLRHPDVVRQENENWLRDRAEALARTERAETEKLVLRARDIVGQMQRGACGEHLVNEIVSAIRWGKTL